MKKIELDMYGVNYFNLAYFGNEYEKKELKGNDYLTLYGALACICDNNKELFGEYGLNIADIIADAAIQSDELCLGGFEGYQISDRLTIMSIYLNKYDCPIVSVYDNKFDRYIDFVS